MKNIYNCGKTYTQHSAALCTSDSKMKFEDILLEINGFGRFQKLLLSLSFLGRFTLPCHFMLTNFIAAVPSHHCDISGFDTEGVFGNLTGEQRLIVSIPAEADGTPSSCLMYSEPQFHLLSNSSNATDLPTERCRNGWAYDNSTFKSTLASEVKAMLDPTPYSVYDLNSHSTMQEEFDIFVFLCNLPLFSFSGTWFVRRKG